MIRKILRGYRRFMFKMKHGKKGYKVSRETLPPEEKRVRTPEEERFGIDAGLT